MEQGQGKKKTEKGRSPGAFRRIWGDFALWTRTFVVCVVDGRKDFPYVTRRLFQVPVDFCAAFTPYYGARKAGRFAALLTDYLFGMARFLEKLKCGGPCRTDSRAGARRHAPGVVPVGGRSRGVPVRAQSALEPAGLAELVLPAPDADGKAGAGAAPRKARGGNRSLQRPERADRRDGGPDDPGNCITV